MRWGWGEPGRVKAGAEKTDASSGKIYGSNGCVYSGLEVEFKKVPLSNGA